MQWDFVLLFVLLGVLVPWHGRLRIREVLARESLLSEERLAIYASTLAAQWALAAIVLWRSLDRGLTQEDLALAWPGGKGSIVATLLLTAALLAHQLVSLRRLARIPAEKQGIIGHLARKVLPQNLLESLAFVALAVTVSLCEELIYRGFAFAALAQFSESTIVAVAGSAALFSLAHAYQGKTGLITTFIVGLILAAVREMTGSLVPCIVAHLIVDLVAGFGARRYAALADINTPTGQMP